MINLNLDGTTIFGAFRWITLSAASLYLVFEMGSSLVFWVKGAVASITRSLYTDKSTLVMEVGLMLIFVFYCVVHLMGLYVVACAFISRHRFCMICSAILLGYTIGSNPMLSEWLDISIESVVGWNGITPSDRHYLVRLTLITTVTYFYWAIVSRLVQTTSSNIVDTGETSDGNSLLSDRKSEKD